MATENRKEYESKMEMQLRAAGQMLDLLWVKARETKGDARKDVHQQIAPLREKQQAVRQKLEELKRAEDSAWQNTKVDAEKVYADLKGTLEKVVR